MSTPLSRPDTQLIDDAHRTATRLDTVASELNTLVAELRDLLEQLGRIEGRRQRG